MAGGEAGEGVGVLGDDGLAGLDSRAVRAVYVGDVVDVCFLETFSPFVLMLGVCFCLLRVSLTHCEEILGTEFVDA